MTTWWALCRREWLEHRMALFWVPIGLLCLFILSIAVTAAGINPKNEPVSIIMLQQMLPSIVMPFTWLYFGTATMVLLASLVEERKDRSILFWKSMPVTDAQTVLSKLFFVSVIGSAISAAVIICAHGFALLLANFSTDSDATTMWLAAQIGSNAVNWVCGYLSQVFWLLPLWGWLLLVSAMARGIALFWAIAIPLGLIFVEWIFFNTDQIITSILRHADLRALPTHIGEHSDPGRVLDGMTNGLPDYLPLLGQLWRSSSMWLGILAGCIFISAAIVCRGRNNEL